MSTLPCITTGLGVWNVRLATTSRALPMLLTEMVSMSYVCVYSSSLDSVSDMWIAFWLLCLIAPFFQSAGFLKMALLVAKIAHRGFGWTTITWMLFPVTPLTLSFSSAYRCAESLVLDFLIEILLPFFWDCFVGSREYNAFIWDASPRCFIVTSMASCWCSVSMHCLTVTFLPFAISFRLHSGFMQPWIHLSTTRNSEFSGNSARQKSSMTRL